MIESFQTLNVLRTFNPNWMDEDSEKTTAHQKDNIATEKSAFPNICTSSENSLKMLLYDWPLWKVVGPFCRVPNPNVVFETGSRFLSVVIHSIGMKYAENMESLKGVNYLGTDVIYIN